MTRQKMFKSLSVVILLIFIFTTIYYNYAKQKIILNYGDSIAHGSGNNKIGYARIIAKEYKMRVIDKSINGATIKSGVDGRESISDIILSDKTYRNVNYILIEGGYNDIYHKSDEEIGSISPDENVESLSTSNLYGALEVSFCKLKERYPESKILFVIIPRIGETFYDKWDGVNDDKFNTVRQAIIECCDKWGIEYVDLFTESEFNSYYDKYKKYTNDQSGKNDGIHPTEEGYKLFYVPIIKMYMDIE